MDVLDLMDIVKVLLEVQLDSNQKTLEQTVLLYNPVGQNMKNSTTRWQKY